MKQTSIIQSVSKVAPFALAVICGTGLLSGCSSSSSSGSSDASINGTIVAAPVNGANVSVVDGSGNVVAGPVKTDATGQYTLSIPDGSLGQDLIVKSTGGAFTDEATGNSATADEMFAYASANSLSNGSKVSVTPGSTIIANLVMNHNKTMVEAQNAFIDAFAYTPDVSVSPADATGPAVDTTEAARLAGFRAAVFSQLAMDLGLSASSQFDLFTALAQDLSDGVLDGVDASGAVAIGSTGFTLEADIKNRFSMALVNFHANANNATDLSNAQIGSVPFARVALTANYQLEYIQTSMMGAMVGKSTFQVHVTNRSDGSDATGLAIMLMPMMHMATMNHSSPMPATAISEGANGLYTVTLYYLMPSEMMDGTPMGFWDLKLTVAGEEAHLYPAVMMAMGDTTQVRLKGVADTIMNMDGLTVGRTYFIFKESLTAGMGMGSYDFSVFIASQESMMSFPPVFDGSTLSGNTVDATVEISDDDGASWSLATDGGNGVWSVSGMSLNSGQQDQIRVRLTINDGVVDEMKTTNGSARDVDVNDYQILTVTPGMSM